MSLVRSATSYGNSKLYGLKGSNESSAFSNRSDSCDQNYYCDCLDGHGQASSSGFLNSLFHPKLSAPYQLKAVKNIYNSPFVVTQDPYCCQSSIATELETQSLDGIEMRLKLQELEKVLLDDSNEGFVPPDHCMEVDSEWDDLIHDSPKNSSSDSNGSNVSVNREIMVMTSAKQLLCNCAVAIQDGNTDEASTLINMLRQRVSIQGDPSDRIAAYMVEALAARMGSSGKGLYDALKCKEPPSLERLSAMQVLFEVCPCFRFGFMAANGAIIDAFQGEKRVQIIDFDINQGSQYITLIQTIAKQLVKPPKLRLTGVDDPESVQHPIGGLNLIGLRLKELAKEYGVPFEFRAVAAKTSTLEPAMLKYQPGEALLVNFAYQLHHMPDESVSTVNQRDQLLRMVKSMNPKLVTVVEQNANTNTAPFLTRFNEVYNYYYAIFDSLDATLPRDSQDRVNVEKQCLAREIINTIACEGEERIERYELAGKWRARLMMAGFASRPISPSVSSSIRDIIGEYSDRYKVKEDAGALHFGWEGKVLVVASAWR